VLCNELNLRNLIKLCYDELQAWSGLHCKSQKQLKILISNIWNYCYGLDDRVSRVRFPTGAGNFSLHHRVQDGFEAHPASYLTGTTGSFPGGKATGAWSWPLNPTSAEAKEWVELYLHSPMHLHGVCAQLKHRDDFTFTFLLTLRLELYVSSRHT
jgi:hypothetical protein